MSALSPGLKAGLSHTTRSPHCSGLGLLAPVHMAPLSSFYAQAIGAPAAAPSHLTTSSSYGKAEGVQVGHSPLSGTDALSLS
jgi:hypothetical protein